MWCVICTSDQYYTAEASKYQRLRVGYLPSLRVFQTAFVVEVLLIALLWRSCSNWIRRTKGNGWCSSPSWLTFCLEEMPKSWFWISHKQITKHMVLYSTGIGEGVISWSSRMSNVVQGMYKQRDYSTTLGSLGDCRAVLLTCKLDPLATISTVGF